MKKCINCEKVSDKSNNLYCEHCGGKLVEWKSIKCRKCGADIDSNSAFCKYCGESVKPDYSLASADSHGEMYMRESIDTAKGNKNKTITVFLMSIITVCIIVIATIVIIEMVNKPDENEETVKQTTTETGTDEGKEEDDKEKSIEEIIKEKGLHDYNAHNDDWYRIRKSKWDPSTQVGAYKTIKKALEDAAIYRPQGYVLYDKDFNVIE